MQTIQEMWGNSWLVQNYTMPFLHFHSSSDETYETYFKVLISEQ